VRGKKHKHKKGAAGFLNNGKYLLGRARGKEIVCGGKTFRRGFFVGGKGGFLSGKGKRGCSSPPILEKETTEASLRAGGECKREGTEGKTTIWLYQKKETGATKRKKRGVKREDARNAKSEGTDPMYS